MTPRPLEPIERRLLNECQHDLPLEPRPFAAIAARLGVDEADVLEGLRRLSEAGIVSRVGAVVAPHRAGWSTLAAMQVSEDMVPAIAEFISGFEEVNHNYEREHQLNLWFVVTAGSDWRVAQVLREIEYRTGLPVIDLPLVEAFRLDLGFPLP